MKDPVMKDKHAIEARLHRSLKNQVAVPKLDRRFDAAVWARIDAEKSASARIANPPSAAANWLRASNVGGMIVAGILVAYFGLRLFNGAAVDVPTPHFSMQLNQTTQTLVGWGSAAAALIFGLMLTPMGKRLRMSLD